MLFRSISVPPRYKTHSNFISLFENTDTIQKLHGHSTVHDRGRGYSNSFNSVECVHFTHNKQRYRRESLPDCQAPLPTAGEGRGRRKGSVAAILGLGFGSWSEGGERDDSGVGMVLLLGRGGCGHFTCLQGLKCKSVHTFDWWTFARIFNEPAAVIVPGSQRT